MRGTGVRGLNLRYKITLMFSVLLFLAVLIMGAIVFYQSRQLVVQSLSAQLSGILEKGLTLIDSQQYADLLANGDESSPYYAELRQTLNDLRDKTGSKYLYTMKKDGDKYYFIVDGMPLDSDEASAFGDEEDMDGISKAMQEAFLGQLVIGDVDNTAEWGKLLSGYAPIKGPDGQVLGIIGVDFPADKIYNFLGRTTWILVISLIVILGIGLMVGYAMARHVTRPLEVLAAVSQRVRDGDLSVSVEAIERRDEIGNLYIAFNDMVTHLRSLVEKIRIRYEGFLNGVQILEETSASTEDYMQSITHSIHDVTTGSDNQLSKLSEAVGEIANMANYIGQIDESSRIARDLSEEAEKRAQSGCQVLATTKEQVTAINRQASDSAEVIRSLSEKISEVTGFMEVIAGIARQTNLLALNAAIESARAGKEGLGFAVVAREIRSLAEESATAAENVARTISQIYQQSSAAVTAIQSTVDEARSGASAIDRVENEFASVLEKSHLASQNIARVAEAVGSISHVSLEIRDGMEKVSAVSEETNAASEEVLEMVNHELENIQRVKDQSQMLVQLAEDLRQEILKFRL